MLLLSYITEAIISHGNNLSSIQNAATYYYFNLDFQNNT
jgi:hypothetical protein